MINTKDLTKLKCGLIVGHPGHELRVYGWLRKARPAIAILTDGSGHDDVSRIALTKNILGANGLYGLCTDKLIYKAILEQDLGFFRSCSEQLRGWLIKENIECVVGDAIEGYNPTHDICRLLIDQAVRVVSSLRNKPIYNYAFPLTGPPRMQDITAPYWTFNVDPSTLAEKVMQTKHYAQAAGGILIMEVEEMLQQWGEQVFAEEVFYSMDSAQQLISFASQKPFYETHGEKQVAAGHYKSVIRYKEHMAPIAEMLAVL